MKQKTISSVFILFSILVILLFSSCTSNWPQFRGTGNSNVSDSKALPQNWANDTNVVWTSDITGLGNSSPIVWGDKVFITAAYSDRKVETKEMIPSQGSVPLPAGQNQQTAGQAPPPPPPPAAGNQAQQRPAGSGQPPQSGAPGQRPPEDLSYLNDTWSCEVTCVELETGRELWKQIAFKGKPRIKKHAMNTYANETPVTDGKRLYVYFGMIGVFCYDLNGTQLWQKDLGAYETQNGWGTGASPVVWNDLLFIKVDNDTTSFITALDAASGKEVWKVNRDEKTTYSTPVIWENKVRAELVTTGKTTRSYDPLNGKLLWELKMVGESSIPSPVYDKNHIYLGNTGGREVKGVLYAVKAGAEGNISLKEGESTNQWVAWSNPETGLANPSPLLFDGLIYVMTSRGGELTVVDAATGTSVYKQKIDKTGACWASPWANNGKILFYDEKGITHILKAGTTFEELGINQLDDKFWASVAITRDAYIFRGAKKLFYVKGKD